MKKILLIPVLLLAFAPAATLRAQNKEIPNKNKPVVRPQTGGPEGGDGSMSKSRSNSGSSNSGNRPVYRPRFITPPPYYYYPNNQPVQQNQNGTGVSEQDYAKMQAARKRAEAEVEVKKVLFEMRAPKQAFDVKDVSRPFDIEGAKGFRVSFPELAFVDEEGNPVLGEVEINMTEYTDNTEFAEAGLSTMTDDGKLLETGGMINLSAKSGDKNVYLGKGKSVNIEIPGMKDKEGFQTFYGQGGDVTTWSLNPPVQNEEQKGEFDGYTIRMAKSVQFVNSKPVTLVLFKGWKPLDEYVNENLKVPADVREKILTDGIPFMYAIKVNALGKIKEVKPRYPEYSKNSIISSVQGKIKNILLDAPPLTLSEGNLDAGKTYDILFATAKNYTQAGFYGVKVSAPLDQNAGEKTSGEDVNRLPDSKNVDGFMMQSSGLNKINCDRFAGNRSKDTQNFHFERAAAKVYIVFKEQRSFIQATGTNGDYQMSGIPTGSAVRYVAVVYGDDGTVKMASKDAETAGGPVEFSEYSDFTADALKTALTP